MNQQNDMWFFLLIPFLALVTTIYIKFAVKRSRKKPLEAQENENSI